MPSEYYQLLRWVICPVAAFLAYIYHELDKMPWAIGFGIVALIFNPFIPLYLDNYRYCRWNNVLSYC